MNSINVKHATVIKTAGPDLLHFETNLPSGTWPYEGYATVVVRVAYGSGEEYLKSNFPGLDFRVVEKGQRI